MRGRGDRLQLSGGALGPQKPSMRDLIAADSAGCGEVRAVAEVEALRTGRTFAEPAHESRSYPIRWARRSIAARTVRWTPSGTRATKNSASRAPAAAIRSGFPRPLALM